MGPENRPDILAPLQLKRQLVSRHRCAGEDPHDPEAHRVLVLAAIAACPPALAEIIVRMRIDVWIDDDGTFAVALPGRESVLSIDDVAAAFAEQLLIAGALAASVPDALPLPAAEGVH